MSLLHFKNISQIKWPNLVQRLVARTGKNPIIWLTFSICIKVFVRADLSIFGFLIYSASFPLVHLYPFTQGHGWLNLCQQLWRQLLQNCRVHTTWKFDNNIFKLLTVHGKTLQREWGKNGWMKWVKPLALPELVLTFARLSWREPVLSRLAVSDDPLNLVNWEFFQEHYRLGPLLKVLHQSQPLQFNLGLAPQLTFSWTTAILITFDLREDKKKKQGVRISHWDHQVRHSNSELCFQKRKIN